MDIRFARTNNNGVISVHFGSTVTTNIWYEHGWYTITDEAVIEMLKRLKRVCRWSWTENDAKELFEQLRRNYDVRNIGTPYRRDRYSHSRHTTAARPQQIITGTVNPEVVEDIPDDLRANALEFGTAQTLFRLPSIKNHTIGVEIEMYHISRRNACQIVANFFERADTVEYSSDSYDSWYCQDNLGRKWRFMRDGSLSDDGSHCGTCEMTTPILGYDDIPVLQEIVRRLRAAGAKSDPAHDCGVHVHIGARGLTTSDILNLSNAMYNFEALLKRALKTDPNRNRWCQNMSNEFNRQFNDRFTNDMQISDLRDIWYRSQGYCPSNDHYNSTRYHATNLHALFTKKTIEFRVFQFNNPEGDRVNGLHAGELKSYIQLCCALVTYAQTLGDNHRQVPSAIISKDNMDTWLYNLAMVGDEFKTAREVLTRNLI